MTQPPQDPNQYPPQGGQPYGQQPPQGYGQQPYPPQGYAQPPQKKSHTLRNVLLVIVLLFVLVIGGCIALIGGAANEIDNAIDDAASQDAEPGGPDNPLDIKAGEAFSVSGFDYQAGWTVNRDQFGYIKIDKLRVENNRDEKDGAVIEIKFWKGNEVLATDDCTSNQIDVGTIGQVNCLGVDKLPKGYDRITINDTF